VPPGRRRVSHQPWDARLQVTTPDNPSQPAVPLRQLDRGVYGSDREGRSCHTLATGGAGDGGTRDFIVLNPSTSSRATGHPIGARTRKTPRRMKHLVPGRASHFSRRHSIAQSRGSDNLCCTTLCFAWLTGQVTRGNVFVRDWPGSCASREHPVAALPAGAFQILPRGVIPGCADRPNNITVPRCRSEPMSANTHPAALWSFPECGRRLPRPNSPGHAKA